MPLNYTKSISDPVYGTVPLTKFELEIIDAPVFQRLRRVGQLGLANYVFPSADYSRFAHSIGACHTMGQMLAKLEAHAEQKLDEDEWQFRRIAMLLHDVGHYFMSHAAEYALQAHDEDQIARSARPTPTGEVGTPNDSDVYDHEQVGKLILELDPVLAPLVQATGAGRLAAMFKGASDERYWTLVSSELDADRLDYLMRSSQATGLPYGHFDRDYILQSLRVDGSGRVCLDPKAIRAADHFVLCRSFDYLQVIYHKTIVGFEEMLKRCIRYLLRLEEGGLNMKRSDIEEAIKTQRWLKWDDAFVMAAIEGISNEAEPVIVSMRDRLVNRQPARLLWSDEELLLANKKASETKWHRELGHYFGEDGPAWTRNCIYWFKHFRPTDASPFQTTYKKERKDEEAKEKSIQILDGAGSKPLTERKESFTRHLSNQAYVMVRVYYAGPKDEEASTEADFRTLMKKLKFPGGFRT